MDSGSSRGEVSVVPQEIRVWEVAPSAPPQELANQGINLEEDLEAWLESDISMLDADLLVIGRQVPTSYGGVVDLLCIDSSGSLVAVELKRGKTQPPVAAQALDYAAWAKGLKRDEIEALARRYPKLDGSLEDAFRNRFDNRPLPEVLNETHRALIVAESIDERTERIVRYLSDLGVPINVATVQCFRDQEGRMLLAQVYLVAPEEAESKVRAAAGRQRAGILARMQATADENGIGALFSALDLRGTLRPSDASVDRVRYTRQIKGVGQRTVLIVWTVRRDDDDGMRFQLHVDRLQAYMGMTKEQLQSALPPDAKEDDGVRQWRHATPQEQKSAIGLAGVFREEDEVRKLVETLRTAAEKLKP